MLTVNRDLDNISPSPPFRGEGNVNVPAPSLKRYAVITRQRGYPRTLEATAQCPACKDIQTLHFRYGRLEWTRKFTQRGGKVYHDCGSTRPCKIYPSWVESEIGR